MQRGRLVEDRSVEKLYFELIVVSNVVVGVLYSFILMQIIFGFHQAQSKSPFITTDFFLLNFVTLQMRYVKFINFVYA